MLEEENLEEGRLWFTSEVEGYVHEECYKLGRHY